MVKHPTLEAIREAAARIKPHAHKTPVMTCRYLSRLTGSDLFFKCENFQKAGSFKIRGACNAVFQLTEEECKRGVATHSSGNHAAALALAAGLRGIKATIVMPEAAPEIKKKTVAGYGARIVLCETSQKAREEALEKVVSESGQKYISSFNDVRIVAGQGTAALELMEQVPRLEAVMAPVSGGGLLSGTAIAVKGVSPDTRVIGTEPEGADDAYRSFKAGKIIPCEKPKTIADGLRMSLGDVTFPIIMKYADDIVTVSEEAIVRAMRLVWERMKIIIEPSSAVPVAALLEKKCDFSGKRIGVILSGGNLDLDSLPWMNQD